MKRTLETTPGDPKVHCARLDRERSVDEHQECPYCFGSAQDVAAGRHAAFCDFEPGADPVVFGFPENTSHVTKG